MEHDKAGSSAFTNIPLEVLVPFAVDCVMQVAEDLRAILAPVAERLEENRAEIEYLAQLLDHTEAPT